MERKVILITGVSSGLGRATALHLAGLGHLVYGTVRRQSERLNGVKLLRMDVLDKSSVKSAVDEIIQYEKTIDVLINNAGIGIAGAIEDTLPEEFSAQMDANFSGMVNTTQAVIPFMRQQKSGTIINISSIGGLMGLPFQGFYSASKFAVEGLSQALRMELRPFGINVVVINPGDFATPFTSNRKIIAAAKTQSSYHQQFQTTLREIEKHENKGSNPEILARKIALIVSSKKPGSRYIVGTRLEKFSVVLSRFLPCGWFDRILASYYKIQ